jgi:hypothetical protein
MSGISDRNGIPPMSLSVLADFADIIAALAIVLSLIFVGYELHQNRTQAELSNWRELLQTFVDYKGLTHDPEFAAFIQRAQADYHALSADRSHALRPIPRAGRSTSSGTS